MSPYGWSTKVASSSGAGMGCIVKHNTALWVALVAAVSGSLLIGCTSDSEDTTPSATPRATTPASAPNTLALLLVESNYWRAEDGPGLSCDMPSSGEGKSPFGAGLLLRANGFWTSPWCQQGPGTFEVNGDTITWLGGSICGEVKGTYKFTVTNNSFTQTVMDDPCGPRRDAFDGVTYTTETASPSPAAS